LIRINPLRPVSATKSFQPPDCGYFALDPDGAHINLAIGVDAAEPASGAASHRFYPCQIEKLV
jgi:hypothetical protein